MYHVLLIGIDTYPPRYNSLAGCVNDIDAVEQLLLDPPGIGIPSEEIRVTRLATSHPRRPSRSRFQAQTLAPTKANVVQALRDLAGPEVKPSDRILIYYAGHGQDMQWKGSLVWHEALVPHDGHKIDYLSDVEMNALIAAIAARTSDLTVVLDCCHSAGATRDISDVQPQGADRFLGGDSAAGQPPDLAMLGLPGEPLANEAGMTRMLQALDPNYLVLAACQPDQKAGEGTSTGEERPQGILTYSLLSLLSGRDVKERPELRWADIWSELLEKVGARCSQLRRRSQQPWLIGRSERRIFGGPWEARDIGYRITRLSDGRFNIAAGTLMGLTPSAEVAVYGPTPPRFPQIGSPEDQPVGRLKVIDAGRASSAAIPVGTFDLPQGARGRLVRPGESERLRVALQPDDARLASELGQSPLLEIVPAGTPDADVEVTAQPDGGWGIGNDTEALLATVPPKETAALQAGLEWYYRYHTVLRLASNCNDPLLNRSLSVRLLDCSDSASLEKMTQEELADPTLPEVGRDQGIYSVTPASLSCIKISNASQHTLQVILLNCSAGGLVEYLDDATLRKGASHVMWSKGKLGKGFPASADELPDPQHGRDPLPYVTDRLIAIGTTRRDVNLQYLQVNETVQQVVNKVADRSLRSMREKAEQVSNAPAELWTATITPLRIARRIQGT